MRWIVLAAGLAACLMTLAAASGCGEAATQPGTAPLTVYEKRYMNRIERDGRTLVSLEKQFRAAYHPPSINMTASKAKAIERRLQALWKKMVAVCARWEGEPPASVRLQAAHKAWQKVLYDNADYRDSYNTTIKWAQGDAGMYLSLWDIPKDLRKSIRKMQQHLRETRELLREARREAT